MRNWIRHLFAPPVFEDEEKTRIARLLNAVLQVFLASAVLIVLSVPVLSGFPLDSDAEFTLLSGVILIGIVVGLLVLSHRGYLRIVGVVLSLLLWAIVSLWIFTGGGISGSSGVVIYVLVVVLSGLLLGGRAAIAFNLISMLTISAAFYAENKGIIATSGPPAMPFDLVLLLAVLALTGLLLRFALRSITEGFERARENERAQIEANRELQAIRQSLEERVVERTRELARHVGYLQTAAEVGPVATSVLDLDEMLYEVVTLIRERFNLYYVGVFLLDEMGQWAELRAGTGEAGRLMMEQRHRLEVGGSSMIGRCTASAQVRIALDVDKETERFANPLLPDTRSEMALPLISRGQVIGAMTIQSTEAAAFLEEDVAALQIMADQVANASHNARLFERVQRAHQEQQQRSEELAALHEISLELAQEQRDVHAVVEIAARQAMSLLEADGGGVWLWREEDQELELAVTFQVGEVDFTGRRLKSGEGLTGLAFDERKIQVVDDYPAWSGRSSAFDDAPFFAAMSVPMIWQDRVVGALTVTRSQQGYVFSVSEQHLAELLTHQTTAFIQNARLFGQIRRRNVQLQTAAEVSRTASSVLDMDEVLTTSVNLIHDRFALYYVGIFLVDDTGEFAVLRAGTGEAGRQMLAQEHKLAVGGESMIGWCVANAQARIALDVAKDAVRFANPLLPETRSEMALPLISRGQVIGAVTIQSTERASFSEEDISALRAMADQVANAIANSRLLEAEQRRRQAAIVLQEASMKLSGLLEPEQVYEVALEQLELIAPYDGAAISVYDSATRVARPVAVRGTSLDGGEDISRGAVLSGSVDATPLLLGIVERGQPIILHDAQADERFPKTDDSRHIQSWLGVPMLVGDRIIGLLTLDSRQTGAFDEDVALQTATFAAQAGLALENARLFQETQTSLRQITRLHQRYLQEQWEEFLAEEEARQRAGYLFDQQEVQPAGDLWRPEIEKAVARGRTLALTAENEELAGGDGGVRSALAVPLRLRGQSIGALDFIETDRDRQWSEDDIALVEAVAAQVALAVENARAYEELQRTAVQLQEMDRLKSQFLANMSHELRTPLNSIIGFSRVMLKGIDGPLTDLQRADLTSIYNNGQHLLGLINDVLDYSRIEAGKMELVFEPLELAPIIEGVMSTAAGLVKDKPVQLKKEVADDLPIVRADGTRIRQVILNLVSNASKFTEEGDITLRAWAEDDYLFVSVTDSGIGIPEDQWEKIFQEFQQVDGSATRRVGGTGLGLPISRHFVEMHGGRIWLESEMGVGSTFTFSIPIHGPGYIADPDLAALEIDPNRRLVLVVESDEAMVDFYRRYLERHGYQVVGLTDPERTRLWVRELSPFAVLMDIALSETDGWALLGDLKTSRETARVPVIVCSMVDAAARGLSLGATAYLTKPVLEEDLLQALSTAAEVQAV